jgi:hypothetical protein
MSAMNTNGIDVNYPIPGQNNNSQGFRNNFASIKTNLDTASSEISDLQNKVVVKAALNNTVINNDMANTLISNASIRSFRETTYNLGNALAGTVLIDCSLGDIQYGTVAGDVSFEFGSWAPTNTKQTIQLNLSVSNAAAIINFPTEVVSSNNNFGLTTVENYGGSAGAGNITIPNGVSQLNFTLSSVDCGNSISIEPQNRPRQTTQIQQRSPTPKGFQGDVVGTTCVDSGIVQLTVTNTYANDEILTTSTSTMYIDMPVVFTGTTFGGVTAGTAYYIAAIPSATNFTVATTTGGANVNLSAASGNMYVNPVQYMYVAVQDYDSTEYTRTVSATAVTTNLVTLNTTTNLNVNDPIIFSGTTQGGLLEGVIYYIKSIPGGTTITVSRSRTNGVADSTVALTSWTASGDEFSASVYVGSDIWKRMPLTNW